MNHNNNINFKYCNVIWIVMEQSHMLLQGKFLMVDGFRYHAQPLCLILQYLLPYDFF